MKEPLDDDVANNVRKTQNCSWDLICICVAVDYVLCRQQCKVTWGMFLTNFSLCFVLEFDRRRRQILVILVVIIFEFTVLLFPAVLHVLQLLDWRLQCRFFWETSCWWLQFCSQLSIKLWKKKSSNRDSQQKISPSTYKGFQIHTWVKPIRC